MAHYLEITNSEARFAFNETNGDPWHRLGVPVDGYGTLDEMLVAAQADWLVTMEPLFIQGDSGPIEISDKRATVRTEYTIDADGISTTVTPLGVVGKGYAIDQNRDTAQWGLDLVGASNGDAVIDTMGVLKGGTEFFVGIDMGTLVLDPDGINDVIKRYLVVRNSHNATTTLCAYPTNTRVVCWNTATMSMAAAKRAQQVHTVRHTARKEDRKADAVTAMGLAQQIGRMWAEQAMTMIGIDGGRNLVDKAINAAWPKPDDDATDRVKANWYERRDAIQGLYGSATNAGGYGDSGWTAWNAVTEYLDHSSRPRLNTHKKRAVASMDIDGEVAKRKDAAAQAILLVGV